MAKFARVLVDRSGSKAFDYAVPEALAGAVQIGSRVSVPVRSRTALATVVELLEESSARGVRDIDGVIGTKPVVNADLIRLAAWIADYYCCPVEAAMRAVLPQVIAKAEVGYKTQLFAKLARPLTAEEIGTLRKKAPQQAAVADLLAQSEKPVLVTELMHTCDTTRQTIAALEKRGIISIANESVLRDPHQAETFLPAPELVLNAEQAAAFARIEAAIHEPANAKPLLLHGVTGSGKTELYLQAMRIALAAGKTAIMLVPEIALTPQTVERFKSRFAAEQTRVAVLHSHLSQGERHDEWHKINDGQARIVIGARSAVFAPLKNVGLIVVDEEHENSYKQEDAPRYHGRDVAVLRARFAPCAIVLGSATPSLESYHNATTGKYELICLTQRVDDQKMPRIRIIDLRQEARRTPGLISEPLRAAITARLEKKEQSILFLNRRGFSTSLICPSCGHVCECPHCSVSMTFHRAAARLVCHICGHQTVAPKKCPECKDPAIRYSGAGTEKVEEAIAKIFPTAVIKRMDADSMTRRDAYKETLGAFRAGKIDILVGTQMIAKGLHFPNVTLVGIINADLALHIPDFRAGERTFQLLTQVAGRAGRGEVEGEVFVQSYTPFSPSIQFARHHDFDGFWQQEIEFRKHWNYPPFSHMALITIRSEHQVRASFSAETLARRLAESLPAGTTLSDPAPAPLEKARGSYRFHLMLKTQAITKLSRHLRAVLDKLPFPEDVIVTVDIDPYQLM